MAFLIVALFCTFIGGAGYLMYGTAAADVVIFNLPAVLATVCSCLVLVTPPAKFALTMEPVAAAATNAAGGGKPLTGFPRAAVRTLVALAILVAARSLPFLAYVMALVGSFMTISVSVTFPAFCHLTLCKGQPKSQVRASAELRIVASLWWQALQGRAALLNHTRQRGQGGHMLLS